MNWSPVQRTLERDASGEGIGLHTGETVRLTLKPAPENTGVRFQRVDLPGSRPLGVEDIDTGAAPGRTALANGEASVQTVEHLLAALMGSGVDNALVELDGPEVPGMDGSARPFVELIASAGVAEQTAPAAEWRVEDPVCVSEEGASLLALPHPEGYRISYTLHYPSNVLAQGQASFDVTPETFRRELSGARTFCLKAEAEMLRALGLGKGASTENTLVIDGDRVVDNTLRYPDETVRHKILDIVGDLALLGAPVRGHLIGVCSGHGLNRRMVAALRQSATRRPRSDAAGDDRQG